MMDTKYPRTPHLPWSPGATEDDKILPASALTDWQGREVVITEKRDGENTTMTPEGCHARSLSLSMNHPSQTKVRALWGSIRHDIPANFRICGENLAAVHSLRYDDLRSCFEVFSIWEGDRALSWDATIEWCNLLGLQVVPTLRRGAWFSYTGIAPDVAQNFHVFLDLTKQEGYVVRPAESFTMAQFPTCVAKWVRPGHVQTDQHWKEKPVEWNGILP